MKYFHCFSQPSSVKPSVSSVMRESITAINQCFVNHWNNNHESSLSICNFNSNDLIIYISEHFSIIDLMKFCFFFSLSFSFPQVGERGPGGEDESNNSHCCLMVAIGRLQVTSTPNTNDLVGSAAANGNFFPLIF